MDGADGGPAPWDGVLDLLAGARRGGVVAVDTVALDELAGRLGRTADDLAVAGRGLVDLRGVGALVVGADAVHDALLDLARRWLVAGTALADDAAGLGRRVVAARDAYDTCEADVVDLVCLRPVPPDDGRTPR